jgi:type VI secretion system protein ImpE
MRAAALEAAPAIAGAVETDSGRHDFEWLADADPRLGPLLEAVIDGRYFWVPLVNVAEVRLEKPTDLRDVVWTLAQFRWTNGGEAAGLIPTRYPGSESSRDGAVRLARKTEWVDRGGDLFVGFGQRLFATDGDDFPLLEARRIAFGAAADEAAADAAGADAAASSQPGGA